MKMSAERRTRLSNKKSGKPPWDVALLFPVQEEWSEEDYLWLDNNGPNRMIELVDGFLEVLPMTDLRHQRIVKFLTNRFDDHVAKRQLGEVLLAPLPVRLWDRHLREPDVVFFKSHRIKDLHRPPDGADLIIEIMSPGKTNRERDLKEKRRAYAKAQIPEYWIVDPEKRQITVLTLNGKVYKVHGKFKLGDQATSKLLPSFSVDVAAVFAAGSGNGV